MSAYQRIVSAATAAGLAIQQGPALLGGRRVVGIRAEDGARLALDFDSVGRPLGGRRWLANSAGPLTMPAEGLEARVLKWIGRHATAPAPDRDDPFAGPEASARAEGMVVDGGPRTVTVTEVTGGVTVQRDRGGAAMPLWRDEAEALRDRLIELYGPGPATR